MHREKKSDEANVYYGGYLAGLSAEINKLNFQTEIDSDYPLFIQELKDKNAEEVKAYILEKQQSKLREIENLKATKACKAVLHNAVNASAASLLMFVPQIVQRVHIVNYKLEGEASKEYVKNNPVQLPDNFYDLLKDFSNLNTPEALYTPNMHALPQARHSEKHSAKHSERTKVFISTYL